TTGNKVLFTLALIAVVAIAHVVLNTLLRTIRGSGQTDRFRFWGHQAIAVLLTVFFILGSLSIWIGPHSNFATVGGLIGAGIAFALQRFIIAIAGYLVILRGKTFSLGDRIIIGGVRGEVIALDFIQTTVLEMGQPPSVADQAQPAMWVMARQYTGRIVTISNGTIFDQPVYNYTRDFPFIWEEIHVGIGYADNYERAEQILLEAAQTHAGDLTKSEAALHHLRRVYDLDALELKPRVFYRMTDNWVELALRFVVPDRNIREIKDKMYRDILAHFHDDGISVASGTYDLVGMPPLRIRIEDPKQP
ncbi:MAG TPA: hypothetical protein VFL13_10795, partial [Candidatus Baltobacteraceae bacterium]|nr:hypothetical protein [Candidatus Baltobacteraceae bacterium]